MSFRSESRTFHGRVPVPAPVDEAFPLFSPVGEKAWVPGWDPELLHPEGVEWSEAQVFRTIHDGDESIWFVAKLDRAHHSVTYHRVDLGLSATSVSVTCRSTGEHSSEAQVEYRFVGLTGRGNDFVREQTQESFEAKFARWESWIAAALTR